MLDSMTIQERVKVMPPLSTGAGELLSVMTRKNRELDTIVSAIERDSALTAGVLRMVNSAAFALTREIRTVREAVAFLGELKIVGIAMAAAGKDTFNDELTGYRGSRGDLGRHCLLAAMTARELCRFTRGAVDAGVAYTSALLHDIGKVIISDYLDRATDAIFASLQNESMPDFRAAEQKFLGTDHCDCGYEIANEWNLPRELMVGIKYHHIPGDAEPQDQPLAYVVHLADMMTIMHGVGTGIDTQHYSLDRSYVDHVRVSDEELEGLVPGLQEEFEGTAGVLFG